jgi:glutaredoxin
MSELIVYTSPTCGKCKNLIALCDNANIRLTISDITQDAAAQARLLSKGISTLPVVSIGDELIYGEVKDVFNKIVDRMV